MLTGNTDQGTAIQAVNEGNIFRFINKPCDTDTLVKVLHAALEQYHLIHAEKELLENTFQGGIKVLVDILALTNPVAFSRATRIKHYAGKLAYFLKLPDVWKYEVAAMLSQIGCVTIPADVLEKVYINHNLDPNEEEMLRKYPEIGHGLIAHIPRLEIVANMIANQNNDLDEAQRSAGIPELAPDVLGAAILRLAIDYDTLLSQGDTRGAVLQALQNKETCYHPALLQTIRKIIPPVLKKKVMMMDIVNLTKGMILENDVSTKKGLLLAKKGQEITPTMRILFQNHLKQNNIDESVLVAVLLEPEEDGAEKS